MKKLLIFIVIFALIGIGMWFALKKQVVVNEVKEVTPVETATSTLPVMTKMIFSYATSTINESRDEYSVEASYPVVENMKVNAEVSKFVIDTVETFKEDSEELSITGRPNMLWISFKSYASSEYQTFVFTISMDTGGAHPNHVFNTFTFDTAAELVTIQDLIQREYGDQKVFFQLSDLVKEKLRADLGEEVAVSSWIDDGAGPEATNFQDFYVTEGSMHFLFEPYSVAAYALSSREVEVKFEEIKK